MHPPTQDADANMMTGASKAMLVMFKMGVLGDIEDFTNASVRPMHGPPV